MSEMAHRQSEMMNSLIKILLEKVKDTKSDSFYWNGCLINNKQALVFLCEEFSNSLDKERKKFAMLKEAVELIKRLVDEVEDLDLHKDNSYMNDVIKDTKENFLQKLKEME